MIEVEHLSKNYGPRLAVDDLSFTVQKGEICGFLGPNGAGKSTTMKILTGFMPPSEGTVRMAGFDVVTQAMEVKRNIGYLPENPPVYLDMRVRDYLVYAAKLHDVPIAKIRSAVDDAMRRTGLVDVASRIIEHLSKGYRQRVGLAQAIVHNPQVLILDEPTVGLDPNQILEIRSLIKELGGAHTVILSSHILPEIEATCGRTIVIRKGKIVAQDTIDQLTSRFRAGLTYHLLVKQASESSLGAIRAVAGVASVTLDQKRITIQMANKEGDVRDQIVQIAVQQNMGVLEFAADRVTLEDVFHQLTTEENLGATK